MRASIISRVLFVYLSVPACLASDAAQPQSVYTGLDVASCKQAIDKSHPDEIAYLLCPGVGGYTLNVRRVEAGRLSIDVLDAANHRFSLHYESVVTHVMSSLDGKAEWRVVRQNGKATPIALIVAVNVREDEDDPAKVTRTYVSISKITAAEVCVTDRVVKGTKTEAEVHALADSALTRRCAPPLPVAAGRIR